MSGPSYDPVPVNSDHHTDVPYNGPPSPDPRMSSFQTPETEPLGLHPDDELPPGAARPRFLGSALRDDGPQPRESYASSGSFAGLGDGNSSVYGLNPNGSRDTQFYSLNYRDDPHDSDFASEPVFGSKGNASSPYLSEKRAAYPSAKRSRKRWILLTAIAAVAIIAAIVGVVVYFTVVKPKSGDSSVSGGSSKGGKGDGTSTASSAQSSATGKPQSNVAVTGGDGSTVKKEDGSTFVYHNKFGGYWYWDENDPFNNGARAQSWSPALNETFNYGVDKIRGVNLGGWLTTEPFISPALYEKYQNASPPAVDEWTLSQHMAANGGFQDLEEHYKTFITEEDFAQIAAAGLNWVRIPLPWWAIETWPGEPYLPKTAWTYFLKAIQWARKYGIRINLDLHALPGSQNGWNHSGRLGTINFLNGPMGIANAQRALDYIRILAEFISQPQYKDVVPMFGIINEPFAPTFGKENLVRFYLEAYNIVRTASGIGEGKGPYISLHEGFLGLSEWADIFPNADRVSIDIHPYLAFQGQSADGYDVRANQPCTSWAANTNRSMANFGLTSAGEWSNGINDCGLFVNGVNLGTRYEGTYTGGPTTKTGDCTPWTDYQSWSSSMKSDIQTFALASMDALQDYFFWTWKIGNSSVTGKVEAPQWSYKLGLDEGWMPKDPRQAAGQCGGGSPWQPPLAAWQTGGAGAGQIPASVSSQYAWPPTAISSAGDATLLPTYTPTGNLVTLPVPTFTASSKTVDAGNGWVNTADNAGMYTPIPGCSYLDPWVGPTAAPPSPLCSGGAARREPAPSPKPTPPPS